MREAVARLEARRERLLRQAEQQRRELGGHLDLISGTLGRADRAFGSVRRIAKAPVLIAGGIAVTLLLGRGRARRVLATGLTVLGVVLRARSVAQILAGLAASQVVSRSR